MIVMKFGGTAVGSAERLAAAAEIVREHQARRPVVVLSALAGVTDLLERAAAAAAAGERDAVLETLHDLERRHRWALGAVGSSRRHDLSVELDRQFEELRQLLRAVRTLGELTAAVRDAVLAYGELLSTRIAAACLADAGLPVEWLDPRAVMVTDGVHGAAAPDLEATARRARQWVLPGLERGRIPLLGGFVGTSAAGRTTTLGRGGSDTTAAVLGAVLHAQEIQIWTDVDGLMTADPRWVPEARPLSRVSFAEAKELAYFGARVLHPASIAPAMQAGIPVQVRNALSPRSPGTRVDARGEDTAQGVRAIACRQAVELVRLEAPGLRVHGAFLVRLAQALERLRLLGELVWTTEVGAAVVVPEGSGEPLAEALADASAEIACLRGRALLCVVGSGLAAKACRRAVLDALASCDAEALLAGASPVSVAAVVEDRGLPEIVRSLHERFFGQRGPAPG